MLVTAVGANSQQGLISSMVAGVGTDDADDASVAAPPSPSARFAPSTSSGGHSPNPLADVPLQSPIKVSIQQHEADEQDLPEL